MQKIIGNTLAFVLSIALTPLVVLALSVTWSLFLRDYTHPSNGALFGALVLARVGILVPIAVGREDKPEAVPSWLRSIVMSLATVALSWVVVGVAALTGLLFGWL